MVLVCCIYSCRRTARVSPNYRALRTVHSTCSSISGTAENGCAACAAWLGCLMPQFIYRVDSSVCECCCVLGFSRVAMSRTVQSSVIQHEEYLESSMAFISQIAVNRAVAHPPGRYWSWSPIWSISPYLWGYQGFLHTYGGAKNWRNTTTVSIVTAYTVPRIFQKKKKKNVASFSGQFHGSHSAPVPWFSSIIEREAEKERFIKNIPWIVGLVYYIQYAVIDLGPVLYFVRYGNEPWLWFGLTNTYIGCRKRVMKASMKMTQFCYNSCYSITILFCLLGGPIKCWK